MTRDPRVDLYIEGAQPFARPILSHVRERVHAAVPNVEEALKWGAPGFVLDGKILLIMAAFKAHAVVSFWRGQEIRGEAAKPEAMGQFGKLTSLSDLPPDAQIEQLVKKAVDLSRAAPRTRQVKHVPAEMHPDFAKALAEAPTTKANFEALSPSCRREYVDWIAEAKRDETRVKRIATAIEWIGEGKKKNWKYERC